MSALERLALRRERGRPGPQRARGQPFIAAFAGALRSVDADHRLPEAAARELRHAIRATTPAERSSVAFEPEAFLGPFEALSASARGALVAAIVERERIEMRGYELGDWYWALLRLLWRIKRSADRRAGSGGANRIARETTDVLAYGTRKAPAFAIGSVHRLRSRLRARFALRPLLYDTLNLAGIDPRDFGVCYARTIPQSPAYRGYWHDASRRVTVGRVLGIDLLPGEDGWWFVESNAHPALEARRASLFGDCDPMIGSLFDFAERHRYRHLVVLDNTSTGIEPGMERQYVEQARARGMELTLPALPNVPGRVESRSYGIPPLPQVGTLVVRIRPHPHSLDHLLGQKRAGYRALARYLRQTNDPDLYLPATGPDPLLGAVARDDPFPNLVYKLPDIEQGRGVYFLKAESAEHARRLLRDALKAHRHRALQERVLHAFTNKQGLWQPYVKSRLLEDRRLYKVRAMVLLTPVGVEFLSAHRVIAAEPVPESLAEGVVEDTRPWLVNVAGGGRHAFLPGQDREAVAAAAVAAARGLAWAVEYGFRTD